jgi:hypothetical protein
MNINNHTDMQQPPANIPPLSSRWTKLAVFTSLFTLVSHLGATHAGKMPDWLVNLPTIGEIVVCVLAVGLAYWIPLAIGRWVMQLIARGTRVKDFCQPVFMWAFLVVSVISVADGVLHVIIDARLNQLDTFMFICLTLFSTLFLTSALGLYGWLKQRAFVSPNFWRMIAAICIGSTIFILTQLHRASLYFESWPIDFPLFLAASLGILLTGVAHVIYANSAVFNTPSTIETYRPVPNLNHAPADKNLPRGAYL